MALSPIFEFADRFIDEQAALDPCLATARGIPGYDDLLTDFSPGGHNTRADHTRAALVKLAALPETDDNDRLAKDFIIERFATMLLAPDADEHDGCGPERYRVGVRAMLGADLDPQEMYDWAWTDFHYLRSEIAATCARIKPGADFAEVIELLDSDPQRAEHSPAAYQAWLQALTDAALARRKEHFEIPTVMDRCEALLPPEGSAAAAYYTGPSEDFSRPGRTWYPTLGRSMFSALGRGHDLLPRVGARSSSADRLCKGASRIVEPHSAQQFHPRPW